MLRIAAGGHVSPFTFEETAYPGVADIAGKVQEDLRLITGNDIMPAGVLTPVFVATIGHSLQLDQWEEQSLIDLSKIRGKRECYGWFQVNETLVIAGSDKRGTIYGLFSLSEYAGISPLMHWTGLEPPHLPTIDIPQERLTCSKEPSVEYRGFFINDEWPSFGTWATKRFGGVNAKLYAEVFELLLRLKGNYLWPAMWASCFACDGPGLESAELADRWGVVMGTSHHEPCLRHGEEYSHLRGPSSPYGDAWNFRSNKDGITRFWRDGLSRNGHLENVITVGMRGERDSSIMENATLEDNINLLKDVISTQHQLIRETVNPDLEKVPRMLALYKEVEPYYYGDENTPGLKDWVELEDVTLLLCDDNHGYVRTLPDETMRSHRGGFGMYYHFDYHGDPVSYEWINSTELNEVRYEMSLCWEYGVRKLWIVNVGDLGLNEVPLNFFMDLAYDYEGIMEITGNGAETWTEIWAHKTFGHLVDMATIRDISWLINTYTKLSHNRRPEHLNEKSYHAVYGHLAEDVWDRADKIDATALRVSDIMKRLGDNSYGAFVELVGYNALETAHIHRLWIAVTWNHYYAERGLVIANMYADRAHLNMHRDKIITDELHRVAGGRWYGLGLAKHIGFTRWNSEERLYPVMHIVFTGGDRMMVVGSVADEQWTHGGEWTGKPIHLYADDFTGSSNESLLCWKFYVGATSSFDTEYTVSVVTKDSHAAGVLIDGQRGSVKRLLTDKSNYHVISVTAPRSTDEEEMRRDIRLQVRGGEGTTQILLHKTCPSWIPVDSSKYCAVSADGDVQVFNGLGRDSNGLVFNLQNAEHREPWVEYEATLPCEATEGALYFFMLPANPFTNGGNIELKWQLNDNPVQSVKLLPDDYTVGHSPEWATGVITHVRTHSVPVQFKPGCNKVRVYGTCRELVLEQVAFQLLGR